MYVFIALSVYFVLCLLYEYDIVNDEDNIGLSACWPILVVFFLIRAPFWVVRKAAECVRRVMEKNKEDDDA